MFGALRLALAFGAAALVGSWFGLGQPSFVVTTEGVERAPWLTSLLGEARRRVDPSGTDEARELPDEDPSAREDLPHARPALPQEIDPAGVSSMQPWPRLNPEVDVHRAWMLAEGPKRLPGDGRKLVTFTFDDGPFLETTPQVLKLLARYRVHATFFAVGQYLERDDQRSRLSRQLLRRIVDEGHLVGNHTLDHTLLTAISRTRVLDQIDRSASAIERATGKYPYLFRPPYGQMDDFCREIAKERHLELVLWSAEAQDMTRDDTAQMYSEIVAQLATKDGGIVLLHDIRPSSIVVLKDVLKYLHERRFDPANPSRPGYEIVDLPTYLRAVEASPPSYAARDRVVDSDLRAAPPRHRSPSPRPEEVEEVPPPAPTRGPSRVAARSESRPADPPRRLKAARSKDKPGARPKTEARGSHGPATRKAPSPARR